MLRFRTLDGSEIETVGKTSSGSFELMRLRGQPVRVLCDPANTKEARMDTSSGRGLSGWRSPAASSSSSAAAS